VFVFCLREVLHLSLIGYGSVRGSCRSTYLNRAPDNTMLSSPALALRAASCELILSIIVSLGLSLAAIQPLTVLAQELSEQNPPLPDSPQPDPAIDRHPELRRLSPAADVWVNPQAKEVIVAGKIAIDKGPIEFFACPRETKEHESIVAVRSTAQIVHAGLLVIGLEPGRPVSFNPKYAAASGPVVSVTMRWKNTLGKVEEVRAQEWIRNTKTGQITAEEWVFAGSSFWTDPNTGKDYYQADGGDLICVSNFPTAMLDLPVESSQSNDALLFEVFEGRVPARDTEVEIVLRAGKK